MPDGGAGAPAGLTTYQMPRGAQPPEDSNVFRRWQEKVSLLHHLLLPSLRPAPFGQKAIH